MHVSLVQCTSRSNGSFLCGARRPFFSLPLMPEFFIDGHRRDAAFPAVNTRTAISASDMQGDA